MSLFQYYYAYRELMALVNWSMLEVYSGNVKTNSAKHTDLTTFLVRKWEKLHKGERFLGWYSCTLFYLELCTRATYSSEGRNGSVNGILSQVNFLLRDYAHNIVMNSTPSLLLKLLIFCQILWTFTINSVKNIISLMFDKLWQKSTLWKFLRCF